MLLDVSSYKKIEITWKKFTSKSLESSVPNSLQFINLPHEQMLISWFLDFAASIMHHDNALIRYVGTLATQCTMLFNVNRDIFRMFYESVIVGV